MDEIKDYSSDPSTEKLIERLRQLDAPAIMFHRARMGAYHLMRSEYADPTTVLWSDAGMYKLPAQFLQEVLDKQYQATKEELDAIAEAEGETSIDN